MSLSPSVGARPRASVVLAALTIVSAAHAQCPTVINVPGDAASIDEAVAMVCAETTAEIVVGPGTWGVEVDSAPGSQITIRGAGRELTLIVPSVAGGRIVANGRYEGNNSVRFEGVRIEGGSGDAFRTSVVDCDVVGSGCTLIDGGVCSNARFVSCDADSWSTLYNTPADGCEFVGCVEPCLIWESSQVLINCTFLRTVGSAVRCWGPALVHVEGCEFDNSKGGAGRAIEFETLLTAAATTRVLEIEDCTFTKMGGTDLNGGAIHVGNPAVEYTSAQTQTTITGCTFEQCTGLNGGAIYAMQGQPVTISQTSFTANTAGVAGGAYANEFGSWAQNLTLDDCAFTKNTAGASGGAIIVSAWDGLMSISNSQFVSNGGGTIDDGGAIRGGRVRCVLNGCLFDSNSAQRGGGVYTFNARGGSTITGCQFRANRATTLWGGAINSYWYGNFAISDCDFDDNFGQQGAAAVGFQGNSADSLLNCVFRNNATGGGESVVRIWGGDAGPGDIMVTSCTFADTSGASGTMVAILADQSTVLGSGTICGLGSAPVSGTVTDAGGNCIVESCADGDGNGTPDACQVVSVPGDYATIQTAIDATPKGEYRIVSLAPGTYAGPIQFGGKSVLVRGAGTGVTVLQGSGGTRSSVVRFNGGESSFAGLEALTVRGGSTGTPFPTNPSALVGGGVFGYESAASIRNCVIEGNASGFGGGAYLWQCTGSITGTTIRQNSATADGGGLQIYGGQVSVVDSTVVANYANSRGGGLHLVSGQTSMTRVSVVDNDSNNVAGGVSWVPVGAPMLVLNDCTVTGNAANIAEGGISSVDDGGGVKLSLQGTRVCANSPAPNVAGAFTADSLSEVCDCIADVTLDGVVNGVDLAVVLSTWGTNGGPTPRADCNRDGAVDGADLAIVLSGWGACSE